MSLKKKKTDTELLIFQESEAVFRDVVATNPDAAIDTALGLLGQALDLANQLVMSDDITVQQGWFNFYAINYFFKKKRFSSFIPHSTVQGINKDTPCGNHKNILTIVAITAE